MFILLIVALFGFMNKPVMIDEERMLARINGERYTNGLEILQSDPQLEKEAQERAEGLCIGEFSHANFMPELTNSKYEYDYAGENLAQGNFNAETHVQAWLDSPTHRDNILKPEYRQTGMGVAYCGHTTIIVEWFATKK